MKLTGKALKAEQARLFKIEEQSGFTVYAQSQCAPEWPFKRTTKITPK